MLSLGGDTAVPRDILTGSHKTVDCVLLGTGAQFFQLVAKLKHQPFGLAKLASLIKDALDKLWKTHLYFQSWQP